MTREEKQIRNGEMREYKSQGHTMQEVAERFGVSTGTAQRICKGVAPQKPNLKGKARNQWTSIDFKIREDKAIQTINQHVPMFEYVGGFTHSDGYVDIKCKTCGSTMSRSLIGIRHGNGVKCHECEKERARRKDKAKLAKQEKRLHVRELKKVRASRQFQVSFCRECGKPIVAIEGDRKYCSKDCYKKASNRKRSSDGRLNRHNTIDHNITLKEVYTKDSGVCQICGGPCDYNDYHYNNNGVFIAGNRYPSIDHIIPLCFGGLHRWDNVRLAHRHCNSKLFWSGDQTAPQKI